MRLFPSRLSLVPRSRRESNISRCSVIPGTAVLYCVTCDLALSSRCVIDGAHRDHRLKDLRDAVHDQVKKLNGLTGKLESKEKKLGNLTPKIEAAEREVEEACIRTQELLQEEYNTLQNLIEHNREQAFFILNAQKETMKRQLHQLHEDAQNYQSKSKDMIEQIKQLNSKEESENPVSLLGEINAIEISLYTMNEFYSSLDEKLKIDTTRLKSLENSINKIVEKNKELLPRPWEFSETITLDENKVQGNIQLSMDKTEMTLTPLNGPTQHTSWNSVWADKGFKRGLHYWEVAVGGCESWAVGVVEQKNMWILECDGNELSALHNNDFTRVKECNIETIGVFLDYDKHRVKFYNVNTGTIVHSFIAQFKHTVYPIFRMCAEKEKIARLKICNLIDKDNSQYISTTISETSETPNEEAMELSSENSN